MFLMITFRSPRILSRYYLHIWKKLNWGIICFRKPCHKMEQWWDLEFLTHQDKLLEASRPSDMKHPNIIPMPRQWSTNPKHSNSEETENNVKHFGTTWGPKWSNKWERDRRTNTKVSHLFFSCTQEHQSISTKEQLIEPIHNKFVRVLAQNIFSLYKSNQFQQRNN